MCIDAGADSGALGYRAQVHSVGPHLFIVEVQVQAWAHHREGSDHRLIVGLLVICTDRLAVAARVAAKAKHQLHHLVECAVADHS